MFKSIKWKFILIYFLLVFLSMSIVGIYIVHQLEDIQMEMSRKNMEKRIQSIIYSSEVLKTKEWSENVDEIQENFRSIQIGYNENLYVILNDEQKTIIAGSVEDIIGQSAFNTTSINNYIFVKSLTGTAQYTVPPNQYEEVEGDTETPIFYHMSYPVKMDGNIKGYIYITNNIEYIYDTVKKSMEIMTQATIIALTITIFLGLVLSSSITGPIKELTFKAKQMSQGDFDQKVNVKSNDEIGQLGSMFNFLIDELKNSISSLQQEKSKMETTFKYMADGVLTVDINGNIIHANPVAKKILLLSETEEKYDDVVKNIKEDMVLSNLKDKNYHGTEILEKGRETYNVDYAPFMNNQNEIGGVIIVFKDITEQYKIDKLQREFVANVSHELKTPITTIKSYAETLLDGALEEKQIAEDFLNVINSESDRMSRLVSDLLRLSRMDYEQTKWKKEKINVGEMLGQVAKKLHIQAKNKNIKMHLGNIQDDIFVLFDRDGFEQILLNIAGNAVKYTPEKGNVWIDAFRDSNKINISIKDDGIGIPKEDQLRVFERFYRVDKARSRELGGTGLGLSIAKQIAEAHNSKLTVNSEAKKGTEIIITIPEHS
ncbi:MULTISPECIES: HAMP domain-containing sensor histidine kinase [unclassified Sedimentibacter]|uniref:HAMP domain-containing sensor histidine kinase n=1 Tax=unclassified Sedimentibacter TaxID=2649220 RepID=UPI0027DF91A1|nr:ATP-binding protein [Sedimentibacter sp. MB35-C1]WMJ77716.1 ATP-binding protein [Sedimentibacter sp. MB35-C1]